MAEEVDGFLLKLSCLNGETPQRPTSKFVLPQDAQMGENVKVLSQHTGKMFEVKVPAGWGPGMEMDVVDTTFEDTDFKVTDWFLNQHKTAPHKTPNFKRFFSSTFKPDDAKNKLASPPPPRKTKNSPTLSFADLGKGDAPMKLSKAEAYYANQTDSARLLKLSQELEKTAKRKNRDTTVALLMRMYSIHYHRGHYEQAEKCLERGRREIKESHDHDTPEAKKALRNIEMLIANVEEKIYALGENDSPEVSKPRKNSKLRTASFSGMQKTRLGMGRERCEPGALGKLISRLSQRRTAQSATSRSETRRSNESPLQTAGRSISGHRHPRAASRSTRTSATTTSRHPSQ